MKIHHIAVWTEDLEKMKEFYTKYLKGRSSEKYTNPKKGFESYFIRFDSGAPIELMRRKDVTLKVEEETLGFCHIAFGFDTRKEVNELTEQLRSEGIRIAGEPRITGDGYYESVILDCEGNIVELVTESKI